MITLLCGAYSKVVNLLRPVYCRCCCQTCQSLWAVVFDLTGGIGDCQHAEASAQKNTGSSALICSFCSCLFSPCRLVTLTLLVRALFATLPAVPRRAPSIVQFVTVPFFVGSEPLGHADVLLAR